MPREATEGSGIETGWRRLGLLPGMEGSEQARLPTVILVIPVLKSKSNSGASAAESNFDSDDRNGFRTERNIQSLILLNSKKNCKLETNQTLFIHMRCISLSKSQVYKSIRCKRKTKTIKESKKKNGSGTYGARLIPTDASQSAS